MALQHILDKITDEAKKKAALMKQAVNDEIKKIEEEADQKAKDRQMEIEEKGGKHVDSIIGKAKTLAVMKGRSDLLKEKRSLIDGIYQSVIDKLTDQNDTAYIALITSMLKHVKGAVSKGYLIVPASRKEQTETAIAHAKVDFDIKETSHAFKGGFILANGQTEINLTFSHVIQNLIRPNTELEVAAILFS